MHFLITEIGASEPIGNNLASAAVIGEMMHDAKVQLGSNSTEKVQTINMNNLLSDIDLISFVKHRVYPAQIVIDTKHLL